MSDNHSTYGPCSLRYAQFRTGLDYQDVHAMMWTPITESSEWRYRGRSGVLGYWHQIKQMMWRDHEAQCEEIRKRIEDRRRAVPF